MLRARFAANLLRQYREVRRARRQGTAPGCLPLLALETTAACNARCGMCGFPTDYPCGGELLATGELCRIVDEAAALGALVISLGGGEPFLRRDAEQLIRHIDGHDITPLVHTNGSLLTPARCERLAENRRLALALSVDSHRRDVHDRVRRLRCFDSLVAAARHFTRHASHVRVVFNFTITGANYRDMLGTLRMARDLGVRTVRFTPMHQNLQHRFRPAEAFDPYRMTAEALPALREEIERVLEFARANRMLTNSERFLRAVPDHFLGRVPHACYAGFFYCSIDPYGNVFPCYDHQASVSVREPGGLAQALRAPAMDELRRRVVACTQRCWNVGTAEPSLRVGGPLDTRQLLREALFFLA